MQFRLFAGRGRWLVTPEFLLPPASATPHGPFVAHGLIDEKEFDEGELHYVRQAIDEDFYATIPDMVISRLRPALASGPDVHQQGILLR